MIAGTRLSMCRSIISFKENNTSDEGSGFAGCKCRGALKKNWKREGRQHRWWGVGEGGGRSLCQLKQPNNQGMKVCR